MSFHINGQEVDDFCRCPRIGLLEEQPVRVNGIVTVCGLHGATLQRWKPTHLANEFLLGLVGGRWFQGSKVPRFLVEKNGETFEKQEKRSPRGGIRT